MANITFEIKYLLQRLDSGLEMTEERVSESEDRLTEISNMENIEKNEPEGPLQIMSKHLTYK